MRKKEQFMAGSNAALALEVFEKSRNEGRIARKAGSRKLYLDFFYHGVRVEKSTGLDDTRRIYRRTLRMVMGLRQSRACSPGCACLLCDFCSSGRDFACGFLV